MFQAWSHQGFLVLLWCRLLRTVEQDVCTGGPQYFQVRKWLDHLLCRMPYLLGLQTSILSCTLQYWGWVHCNVTSSMWCNSYHGTVAKNEGVRFQGPLQWAYRYCKVFEDNSGALKLARLPNFALVPSTSTYAIIIFVKMCKKCLSKYSS